MSSDNSIPNEMILASAGSGKTFQLTNRYIAIMALQWQNDQPVHPERIIAVTFTRKAAGEFFSAILVKLAKAATDPDYAGSLAGGRDDILSRALTAMKPDDFRELLRIFIQRMPRLFLGTLDSFFSNILRSFPAEFGLTTEFEVMDEYRTANAIDQVYEAVFSRRLGTAEANDADQALFLEAFRQATFGKEESNVIRSLDEFVTSLHQYFLSAPEAKFWGDPTTIWNRNNNRWLIDGIEPLKEFERLERTFEEIPEQINEVYWSEFRAEIEEHQIGTPFGKRTKYMVPRFLAVWDDLENGNAAIKFNRTVHEFDPVACEAVRRITQWLVGGELRAKLRRTRGVWELLHLYENTYADRVRRQGQLTFQDIPLLLSGHEYGDERDAPLLTQSPEEDDRLRIDYRLDARYDHWLLDEFQDTNFVQWKVIRNLIDEVVQDTSGTRSLFQVGDIKQAIYAWRGGDTRLFTDIFEQYNANEKRILPRNLNVSYRSVEAILEPVNQLFGDAGALTALGLPDATVDRWKWENHEVAGLNATQKGYTAFLNPRSEDEDAKPDQDDLFALVRGVLEEVRPTERGISCAILVRSNARGNDLIDNLRSHLDIPVVSEADQHIATDNPVNLALLSLFQLAAHPGDRFAWEHLKMTPYEMVIRRDELTAAGLARRTASDLFRTSFEDVTRRFVEALAEAAPTPFDEFTRGRIEAFALAARLFDETGSRDLDDFLAYVSRHTTREAVDDNAVQVMTYHKSKGLTFDMVILPDLRSDSLTSVRLDIGAKTNESREIEWVLDMPGKDIVAADPVLGEFLEEKEAESAYESLCLYYVGMTRARYANYLIALPQGPKSRSKNFVKLLEDTIADEPKERTFGNVTADLLFQSASAISDRNWFEQIQKKEEATEENIEEIAVQEPEPRFRPRRRTPSGSENSVVTAAQIFHPGSSEAREFGTRVHELFEEIEWWTPKTLSDLEAGRSSDCPALEQVRQSLSSAENQAALTKPSANAAVWREKSFEVLLEHEWFSGTFDRVTIEKDENGEPTAAAIIDFKTDRIASPEDIEKTVAVYRPQLETYRQVLALMLGLPTEKITASLLFTRLSTLVEL